MRPWRLLNILFGFQYVHMQNSATEIIRRVRVTPRGERYVCYFGSYLVFIDRDHSGWLITALTPNT